MEPNIKFDQFNRCPFSLHKFQVNPIVTPAESCNFCHKSAENPYASLFRLTKPDIFNGKIYMPLCFCFHMVKISNASKWVRFADIGLALGMLGIVLLMAVGSDVVFGSGGGLESHTVAYWFGTVITWMMFFLVPLGLASATILAAITGRIGIGSIIAAAMALLALPVMIVGLFAYVTPGGGAVVAPFASVAAGFILAVVVLVRPVIDRASMGLWSRPGLIDPS